MKFHFNSLSLSCLFREIGRKGKGKQCYSAFPR